MDVFGIWSLIPVAGLALIGWYVLRTSGRYGPGRGLHPRPGVDVDRPAPAKH